MATVKSLLKGHFIHVDTEFLLKTMISFCGIFLACVYSLILKIYGLFSKYVYRSKSCVAEENDSNFSANHSQREDEVVSKEGSVLLQSGLIGNYNKCQFVSEKSVSGYLQEPKTAKFMVQEMFGGSNEVLVSHHDQNLAREISEKNSEKEDSLEQKLEENMLEFDEEESESSFSFSLFNNASCSTYEHILELEKIDQEKADIPSNSIDSEQDFSYEIELFQLSQESDDPAENDTQKTESNDPENWMSNFLDEKRREEYIDQTHLDLRTFSERFEDLDDDYIELEPLSGKGTRTNKAEVVRSSDNSQEEKNCWDSHLDEDEQDEPDVLWEHHHLVQQMKMELKNCRIRGLPTISEECETPKMAEDLKPLQIDHKIEYKDIMEEIQKFYKSYMEKMRKLDILNYQTLHAISFVQLKDSEAFATGKKMADSLSHILPKLWTRKRIYADPMHKSIVEMYRDLELVYVGQLCLSWEILCWLYVKAQELLEYDSQGDHSYNRVAEEFQQFQVLMQRFMEDEPFQGYRNQNYVKSRCTIRSLLQVPTIKDDCVKVKKERKEETDAISLWLLVEIIRESMLIVREFLFADTNSVLKGIHGTKFDLQDPQNSELRREVVWTLQKKERRIREQIRSQNCIVKKLRKQQECGMDREILISQVELRLVSRVLCVSRLTEDHLVWCKNKLNNINFVGRKVHVDPSCLLFPC